jgi:hypothetical protein
VQDTGDGFAAEPAGQHLEVVGQAEQVPGEGFAAGPAEGVGRAQRVPGEGCAAEPARHHQHLDGGGRAEQDPGNGVAAEPLIPWIDLAAGDEEDYECEYFGTGEVSGFRELVEGLDTSGSCDWRDPEVTRAKEVFWTVCGAAEAAGHDLGRTQEDFLNLCRAGCLSGSMVQALLMKFCELEA